MTAKELLTEALAERGIGLKNEVFGCYCDLDDLMPCGECVAYCLIVREWEEINGFDSHTFNWKRFWADFRGVNVVPSCGIVSTAAAISSG